MFSDDNNKIDKVKVIVVIILVAVVSFMSLYFFILPPLPSGFLPGSSIDQSAFKTLFTSSNRVFILMDVRGVADDQIQRKILQCGVDFAGSSGMAGKNVSYLSVADEGCVSVDGIKPINSCFRDLKDGLTIYIRSGDQTSYYTNGLVVGVGESYIQGTCGIRRT